MCGIAGIISQNPALASPLRLKLMTDALAHRGPDGEGFWKNEQNTVLFGHRRLSIIDLSDEAAQPMQYDARSAETPGMKYTIIHNGEIYNYLELREELQQQGYSFRTQSDTEVILAAYDCWKDECVEHFDGMFSFAIWDEEMEELFAARDRFGEKPFFYHFNGGQFIFASEMKALWAAGVERKPNLKMLFNFLTIGYADNPEKDNETFFDNIQKLPAASRLYYSFSDSEPVIHKYWETDPGIQNKTITDKDAIEKFNHLLTASVKKRMRSDVFIGTSLSGGPDSSTMAAITASLNAANDSHKCFTAVFPGFEKDELSYAQQVAEQFRLQHFTVTPNANSLVDEMEKLFYHQEEPFNSTSIYAQYKVYELARQHNVKVLLDGQGADETLAGYHKYYKWYWQELFRKRKLASSRELQEAKKMGITETFGWKNRLAALFPEFASVVLEKQYLINSLRHEDLNKEFVRLHSKEAYYTTPPLSDLNGVLHFNTFIHGLEELLRYADRNSMAHGCEVRLPFLSHELVAFVFSLPPHFKIRQGWTKWILRKSMENILPGNIIWRRDKTGFEPPQKEWMTDRNIQQSINAAKEKLVQEKILKPESLHKKINPASAYEAENSDWRYFVSSYLFK